MMRLAEGKVCSAGMETSSSSVARYSLALMCKPLATAVEHQYGLRAALPEAVVTFGEDLPDACK